MEGLTKSPYVLVQEKSVAERFLKNIKEIKFKMAVRGNSYQLQSLMAKHFFIIIQYLPQRYLLLFFS